MSIKVRLRWCIAHPHSGAPFGYDVSETTTIGELCAMVIATNNEWFSKNYCQHRFSVVKICGPNDTFLDDSTMIGGGHYQNECFFVFWAG